MLPLHRHGTAFSRSHGQQVVLQLMVCLQAGQQPVRCFKRLAGAPQLCLCRLVQEACSLLCRLMLLGGPNYCEALLLLADAGGGP